MDVSQLYMAALRPTGAPIAGESADNLFFGQVELKEWSWDFINRDVKKRYDKERAKLDKADDELAKLNDKDAQIKARFSAERRRLMEAFNREDITRFKADLEAQEALQQKAVNEGKVFDTSKLLEARSKWTEASKKTFDVVEDISKLEANKDGYEKRRNKQLEDLNERESEEIGKESGFSFKFSKRVDVATTQLLNVMKAGELLPSCILTMHQASSNTPWSLVITVNKVRLIKYDLKVDTNDTMTDMLEDWECEFETFGYVYQNRPHAGIKSMTAGKESTIAARAATQMTVRTFMMKNASFW